MNSIDWTHIYEDYKGLWVALKPEDEQTVVGSGTSLREALDDAARNGYARPVMINVLEEVVTFVGAV
jgi:hypothetical protein